MPSDFEYRSVHLALRAPRAVVVFDASDDSWMVRARIGLAAFTATWGGSGFVLVPHRQGRVHPALVAAAVAYDPDYVVTLELTVGQQEQLHPGSIQFVDDAGRPLTGAERSDLLHGVEDQVFPDTLGDTARASLAAACAPFRRTVDGVTNSYEPVISWAPSHGDPGLACCVGDLLDTPVGPFITVPSGYSGSAALAAAMTWGALEAPDIVAAAELPHAWLPAVLTTQLDDTKRHVPYDALAFPTIATSVHAHEQALAFDRTQTALISVSRGIERRGGDLVLGDSPEDFALAMLLDRTYGRGVWLPSSLRPTEGEGRAVLDMALRTVITQAGHRGSQWLVRSLTVALDGQTAFRDGFANPHVRFMDEQQNREMAARQSRAIQLDSGAARREGQTFLALAQQFSEVVSLPVLLDGQGGVELATTPPVPVAAHAGLRALPRPPWIVDLEFGDGEMPKGRGLPGPSLLADGDTPFGTWIRSGRDGISYDPQNNGLVLAGSPDSNRYVRPRVRTLSLGAWVSAVAEPAGMTTASSPAGKRAEQMARLLGSRTELTRVFSGSLLLSLRRFLNPANKTRSDDVYPEHDGVVLQREGYVKFEGMQKVSTLAVDELRSQVDLLLERRVLRRGLILGCQDCGRAAFVAVDDLRQSNVCPRCGRPNELSHARWNKEGAEPTWFYDLHVAARDLLTEHGEVPLLLAQHLRATARTFSDCPEVCFLDGDGVSRFEADLISHADGRLAVAEAKSGRSLGSGKVARGAAGKRRDMAQLLGAEEVILATTQATWAQGSVEAMTAALARGPWPGGAPPALRVITGLGTTTVTDSVMVVEEDQGRGPRQ